MKKYISMILSFVLAFVPVSAFGAEVAENGKTSLFIESMYQNTTLNDSQQKTIEKMVVSNRGMSLDGRDDFLLKMQLLNYYVMPIENIESMGLENEKLTFEGVQENGNTAEGNIYVSDNGTINLVVKEGEVENQVTLSNDGKIYLDGNEVTFSVEIVKDTNSNSLETYKDDVVVLRGESDQWQTTSYPYGKAKDYSDYRFTASVSDIRLGKAIELVADTALKTILLGMAASLFAETGLWGFVSLFIVYDVIGTIRDVVEMYDEESTNNLSYKAAVYYHEKGHVVGNLLTVHKENQTWYTKANFKGGSENMTVYTCQQYY